MNILVVGSGGGVAGAYTAAREGLSVALIEATDRFGGTTAYSGGGGMWMKWKNMFEPNTTKISPSRLRAIIVAIFI